MNCCAKVSNVNIYLRKMGEGRKPKHVSPNVVSFVSNIEQSGIV